MAAMEKMKSMSEWTEEDFWKEMTELYVKCKTVDDVRSVKQILELKAKTMGLLEEKDKGGVNNFLMLTEKAVVALNSMGVLGRRSVVHDGVVRWHSILLLWRRLTIRVAKLSEALNTAVEAVNADSANGGGEA